MAVRKEKVAFARKIERRLAKEYPDAHCELDHRDPFELAVATILSAQCTDKRVNLVTPELFRRWPDAHALDEAPVEAIEEVIRSTGFFRDQQITIADLGRLKTDYPYVMTLPQVRLLELLAAEAQTHRNFELVLGANVQRLIRSGDAGDSVEGIVYRDTANRWHEVRSPLTVAADGRFSTIRRLAGIEPVRTSPPMDVLWFRLPKAEGDPTEEADIHVGRGRLAVLLDRGDEWQIGYVILKGKFGEVKEAGIAALQQGLAETVPMLADRAALVRDWKQIAVLSVESSRCQKWHQPGLLLIGDAAHAMSPVGGVGINYAVQDAIVAANLLAEKLRGDGPLADSDLAAVQSERERPVRFIQRVQRANPRVQAFHEVSERCKALAKLDKLDRLTSNLTEWHAPARVLLPPWSRTESTQPASDTVAPRLALVSWAQW